MPLVLKSPIKKVIAITSGMGDPEMAVKLDLYESPSYSISKIALNMAIAKFQAEYNNDGVLFLAICPGAVNTGQFDKSMCNLPSVPRKSNMLTVHSA